MAGVLAPLVGLLVGLTPVSAEDAHSSIEDRKRFVSIARQLEQDALNPGLLADRQWAMNWLDEAPDISVVVCANVLGGLLHSDYRYRLPV